MNASNVFSCQLSLSYSYRGGTNNKAVSGHLWSTLSLSGADGDFFDPQEKETGRMEVFSPCKGRKPRGWRFFYAAKSSSRRYGDFAVLQIVHPAGMEVLCRCKMSIPAVWMFCVETKCPSRKFPLFARHKMSIPHFFVLFSDLHNQNPCYIVRNRILFFKWFGNFFIFFWFFCFGTD